MKKVIFARGNSKRGAQVIEALEKRGGENSFELHGKNDALLYFIESNDFIDSTHLSSAFGKLLLEYGEEVFLEDPEPQILTWEDLEKTKKFENGYYVNCFGDITEVLNYHHCNAYYTEAQAKSARALSKISQLIEQPAYGGWCPIGEPSYGIFASHRHDNSLTLCVSKTPCSGGILRFHTREQAALFLKHNEQLVKDYLMI